MVLPKSGVYLSRIAGTALKSFTHGYAQTVVAASQSSYASQNTPVAPLASNLLSRINSSGKVVQNAHHSTVTSGHVGSANEPAKHEQGLAQYHEAWHKTQKGDKEWNRLLAGKRLGWKAQIVAEETDVEVGQAAEVESLVQNDQQPQPRDGVKRSYSTSAVDNFGKAIDDEVAEAAALAQVNEAIAGEVSRKRDDASAQQTEQDSANASQSAHSPVSDLSRSTRATESTEATSVSEADPYTVELEHLVAVKDYAAIPAVFQRMLQDGVTKPSQLAYRALLNSAINITHGKHQRVPRVLEIYSDMLHRKVVPDADTCSVLINVLALRSLEAASGVKELQEKFRRYKLSSGNSTYIFKSDQMEHEILSNDQSLTIALKISASASATNLSTQSYESLIIACAVSGRLAEMMHLYARLESSSIAPSTSIFPAMIGAFAAVGDLRNVVECYDEYRELAIANNDGANKMGRIDNVVYAAVIKAYEHSGRTEGGQRFLNQIVSGETNETSRQEIRDVVAISALIPKHLETGDYAEIYNSTATLSDKAYPQALQMIATVAADQNNIEESTKAFDALLPTGAQATTSAMALLAMYVRKGDVEAAEPFWRVLETSEASLAHLEPTVVRAIALCGLGQFSRGLRQSRNMFSKIRNVEKARRQEVSERIEEAIETLCGHVSKIAWPASMEAATELLRMMNENGSLMSGFAHHALASIGPEQISQCHPADLDVLTQTQARLILDDTSKDIAGPARFGYLLENVVARAVLPDVTTENMIEKTLVNLDRSDLSRLWNNYRYPITTAVAPPVFSPVAPAPPHSSFEQDHDPYAARTDNKGSVAITDLLERGHGRPSAILNEALTKFRNMRRAGRHPRFFAYNKLITAAAKNSQFETARDIVESAKQDVPYLPQFRVVRYGWIALLDSMLAACLMTGRREAASNYHEDLLSMGSAPSANTYGLYITTLKENTKTSDEASEAVKVFLRSKAEGVEPTSFLYNALIGKLGKARRIDDCLFYFAEMRNLGIRPTSVTYGTIVNALCRVSDEKFAEEMFEEMESCTNYKARPAPYHSLMQYFLSTKRDRSKVLSYFERMQSRNIEPTMHTYKLLIDAHATLDPIDMSAAESVLAQMRKAGVQPEAVHHASLIHAKGCVLQDIDGARALFDSVVKDSRVKLQPCVYQAMFEALVANRQIGETEALATQMKDNRIEMTPYIANALIHGWTLEKDLDKARHAFGSVNLRDREPSTYEAMVRAHIAVEDITGARAVVKEALSRGYPPAVAGKITELVDGGRH